MRPGTLFGNNMKSEVCFKIMKEGERGRVWTEPSGQRLTTAEAKGFGIVLCLILCMLHSL